MNTKTMQHLNPIWRDEADFIIGIKLPDTYQDYDVVWEQLWSKKIANNHFKICCIPFFAKDLCLGDEVETDANYLINKVVSPSGQYTFRVWFGDSNKFDIREMLIQELHENECVFEWYSNNLLAISCSEIKAKVTADILSEKQNLGLLLYETGKTVQDVI